MKQAAITKSLEEPTSAELEQISRFARRPLKPEEVYLFSLVLCDNDVDRDLECFPRASLEKLAELFVGKTGIFDHNPKGENQTARIYKTQVLETPGRTAASGDGGTCRGRCRILAANGHPHQASQREQQQCHHHYDRQHCGELRGNRASFERSMRQWHRPRRAANQFVGRAASAMSRTRHGRLTLPC